MTLTFASLAAVSIETVKAETSQTLLVPQDFSSISAAVANASQGDTILVKSGVYHENLIIEKAVKLLGEDQTSTVIDGDGVGTVVWINANNVALNGFTVQNSGHNFTDSGIYVNSSKGVNLHGNTVTDNNIGIYLAESPNSLLRENDLVGNSFNFGVYSSTLEGYIQDIDESNTVDNKPIVYWVNQIGKQVPTGAGYLAAINCTDITVSGVFLEKNWQNALFAYTKNSTVTGVTSTLGEDSIWLFESSNCTLQNNNITGNIWGGVALVNTSKCIIQGNMFKENGGYGLFLSDSSNNQFYHNNFIANPHQAWLYGDNSNSWDNGYPSGGNYWSNYTGTDQKTDPNQDEEGSDGIGDTPIVIAQNNVDNYPLMTPWTQQPNEPLLPPLEFSVMAIIAVTSVLAIFVIYYIKNVFRKNTKNNKEREN
ncbi:MAG: right-handed parallel beta-helix repeat-containing protein [Candidatus Bathyarchaeia archaeon]